MRAAPVPEIGATTAIGLWLRPRYKAEIPMAPAAPAPAPQAKSAALGWPGASNAITAVAEAAVSWLAVATIHTGRVLLRMPPAKSDSP
jgi:hypothetical protein